MEAFTYTDMEGNRHKPSHVDKHHVFAQCRMHTPGEKNFINLSGLVLPMLKVWHNDGKESLHANVPLAVKPERELMYLIRDHIYGQDQEVSVYDRFLGINERIHDIAETTRDIGLSINAARIARNLELQTPYILSGMVVIRPVEELQHHGS